MFANDAGFVVRLEVGGLGEDDLEVQLYDNAIVVEGERKAPQHDRVEYHCAEIRYGPFRMALALPDGTDLERVEARYEKGMLEIVLPGEGAGR